MNSTSRGFRNAFRNTIRSISIITILALSIGLSLAMLVAKQTVEKKIDSVKSSVGNTVNISPAGVRGFEGGGNPLTTAQLNSIKSISHITKIDESFNDRLTTTNSNLISAIDAGSLGQRFNATSGQSPNNLPSDQPGGSSLTTRPSFTPPIVLNGTTNPTNLSSTQGGGTFKLLSGTLFPSNSSSNVAIVGSTLANKNNLKVGSTFSAYASTITVVGIFDAGNTFSNNQIIMPLTAVQTLAGEVGNITSAVLTVDSISNVATVTSSVQSKLGTNADVTNAAQQAEQTVAPLQNIQSISTYSFIGAVLAGSIIILLTMIMIVRERRREIGVIKAIGSSNVKIMYQFMVEAVTLTGIGAIGGIVLGAISANPITHLLVTNNASASTSAPGNFGGGRGFVRGFGGIRQNLSNLHAAVGWNILLDGLLAALVIALIGSSLASFFIAKIRPADVMRAE